MQACTVQSLLAPVCHRLYSSEYICIHNSTQNLQPPKLLHLIESAHARTHACTHGRTHARTHTHTISAGANFSAEIIIYILSMVVGSYVIHHYKSLDSLARINNSLEMLTDSLSLQHERRVWVNPILDK